MGGLIPMGFISENLAINICLLVSTLHRLTATAMPACIAS